MQYLKLRRSQSIIVAFILFALIARYVPAIDLGISSLFFDGASFPRNERWQQLLHSGLNIFLVGSLATTLALYGVNRIWRRTLLGVDGQKVAYLFLVLLLGGGLIVNAGLKDHFGRARPRNVTEFGGTQQFTPAFVVSRECNTNCSFSSGDAAGGYFAIALAMALSRRRSLYAVAIATGTVFAASRVYSGAHFFSDTVVSFFVMLIVADALYYYMFLESARRPIHGEHLDVGQLPGLVEERLLRPVEAE